MRKWIETVRPWPPFKTDSFYSTEVVDIKKIRKQIEITVRILDKEMAWRTLSILLPLPIHPEGITGDFFKACRIAISSGTQIDPKETIGKKLCIQFKESNDKITALSFKCYKQQSHSGKEK